MSKKVSDASYFLKVRKDHLKYGALEAMMLAYVAEFDERGRECFAGRKHISKELKIAPSSVQRIINNLVRFNLVKVTKKGRQRIVKLSKEGQQKIQIDVIQPEPEVTQIESDQVTQNRSDEVPKIGHYSDKYYSDKSYSDNLNINTYTHVHVDHDLNLDPVGGNMAQRVKDDGFTLKGWWDGLSEGDRRDLITYTTSVANPYEKKMLGSDPSEPSRGALAVLFNHSAKLDQLKASLPD